MPVIFTKHAGFLITTIAVCSALQLPAKAATDSEEYVMGKQAFQMRQYTTAVRHFNEAIKQFPNNARYHYERGLAILYLKDKDGALADFEYCSQHSPNLYIAPKYWAPALAGAGKPNESIEQWTKAIKEEPTSVDLYKGRAQTWLEQEQFAKALVDYDMLLKLQPKVFSHYADRAECFMQLKDYPKALSDYNQAIKIDQDSYAVHMRRALCYMLMKQYDLSLADYNTSIKIKPREAKPYAMRAKTYDAMGKKDLADADRKKAGEFGEYFTF